MFSGDHEVYVVRSNRQQTESFRSGPLGWQASGRESIRSCDSARYRRCAVTVGSIHDKSAGAEGRARLVGFSGVPDTGSHWAAGQSDREESTT